MAQGMPRLLLRRGKGSRPGTLFFFRPWLLTPFIIRHGFRRQSVSPSFGHRYLKFHFFRRLRAT
jgi:hypothetical protein